MKISFFMFIMLIFSPYYAISASFNDVKGYWLSEEVNLLEKHDVIMIDNNKFQHGKKTPEKTFVKEEGNGFIIKFEIYEKIKEMSDTLYYKIISINRDKIILEEPTAGGKRKQRIYNRITEEEAQKYLNAPLNHGMNLKPVDDPGF